jgi:hypothetical protein
MKVGKCGVVVATIWFGGCVAEEARVEREPADHQVEGEATATSAVFSGTVTSEQGVPQAGVTVVINGISRITDSTGKYFISVTSVTTGYVLSLSKKGFAPSSEFHAAGETNLQHVLRSGFVATVDPTVDSTVVASSGVTVSLKANSLMTASGAAPTGMVQITVAAYDPLRMPGDFTAVNAAGEQVALESVGAVFIGADDSTGQALELRSGMTSDAFIPVPAAVREVPPCVLDFSCRIAMWKFDPSTGKWVEKTDMGIQLSSSGTRFTMRGVAGTQLLPISAGGLGMWNADIEKKAPACTIIEVVNFPTECYGAGNKVQFNLQLQNSAGTLIPRTDFLSSATPYIVLYNIRANVVQQVGLTLPADAPSTCLNRLTISSNPGPVAGFPVISSSSGVTRFDAGAPWGGTGFPVDGGGMLIDFTDVALGTHPCHSHVWFQL